MAGLETFPGVHRKTVKPQVDVWTFPAAEGREGSSSPISARMPSISAPC